MKFLSLQPFVPSGPDYDKSKQLFQELGFSIAWDAGDLTAFEKDACSFILQRYDDEKFASNLMISVGVEDAEAFWKDVTDRKLPEAFGIRISGPKQQPYGIEVNIIDIAGVCWHFIQ
ncbi:VOC family protein [Chitinophaga vietnamensis]|uniref:hypothetical protein n=1 Tax=Chitinophaga vietnamensis TaxID=2593957 RepID=UPI00117831B4|nr:hypothetical protein [Chitinophaga vietnamensis]